MQRKKSGEREREDSKKINKEGKERNGKKEEREEIGKKDERVK